MASGFFLGGAAAGMQAGAKTAIDQQAETRAAEAAQRADIDKQITATISHIGEIFKAQSAAGQTPDPNNKAVTALLDSVAPLAAKIGRNPQQLALTVGAMAQRPAVEETSGRKLVTTSGGLGEPDRMHIFDPNNKEQPITPIDPKTGQPTVAPVAPQAAAQPVLSPSEVITPAQAQAANPPAPQAAPVAAAPTEDASLPPNAQLTQGPIESRFAEPTAPAPVNHNVNSDVLDKYSPKAQALIKGVADGTIDPSKAFSKKMGKDGESELTKFLGAVKEYDPSFDTANAPARAATLKAFKTGVEARKLSALGTVVGHITELKKDGEALDNWKSDTFGPLTKTANQLRTWVQENKQSPIIRRFDLSANAVSNELETAFRQSNTAISGIQEWRKSINPTMSSDEIAESSKKLGSLLLARMGELKEQWDRGMGHNQDPSIAIKLVKTRELLEKMSAGTLFSDRAANGTVPVTVPGGWSIQKVP